uniref:UBC core domain-containing protein n=1 Tax=Solanum lycopersicum TaxID=4081 RepID=A0A494G8C3_SOLLC
MAGGIARLRLSERRRLWRMDQPQGFVAMPETAPHGSFNLMVWHCYIPGKPMGEMINNMLKKELDKFYPKILNQGQIYAKPINIYWFILFYNYENPPRIDTFHNVDKLNSTLILYLDLKHEM